MLDKLFKLSENRTNLKTEVVAGFTTYMTMAYVLVIHPKILGVTGMDEPALFTVTAIATILGTLLIAFWANLPFAQAPGMGLNAFFAYTVVLQMGYPWEVALAAIFVEGLLFILLTAVNIREAIINSIPVSLKHAISVGIGMFIALMGLINAGIIQSDSNTVVTLGDMNNPRVWIALIGLAVISMLLILHVRGAMLIGIFIAAIAGIFFKETVIPKDNIIGLPPDIAPVFLKLKFSHIFKPDILVVLFTFLFIDMFDTVGTLVGVSSKAGMLDKDGNVPRAKQILFADSVATTIGALLGTSTVTTYVESAAGVAEGGRTGLTSVVVAILFFITLFFSPLFLMIPSAATAPALILIGLFMISPVKKIELENYSEAIPAFLTILIMPLSFSISEGIIFGILSYVILKILTGNFKQVSIVLYILSIFFILRFFL